MVVITDLEHQADHGQVMHDDVVGPMQVLPQSEALTRVVAATDIKIIIRVTLFYDYLKFIFIAYNCCEEEGT